jgi:16S rRNA (guanine527-N7)-methyltransferase
MKTDLNSVIHDTLSHVVEQSSKEVLIKALSTLNLGHSADEERDRYKVDQIRSFVAMMLKWNRTYNLTALKSESAVLNQHIIDSLTVIPNLETHFRKNNIPSPSILDVGSGAGLPGIVLAIMRSNYKICCLDAVEKKTAFVSAVKAQLGLKNLTAKHARVEQLEPVQADVVVSRAFASISDFVELAQKHVSENGRLVAMKAKGIENEVDEMSQRFPCWKVAAIEQLDVPGNNVARCLVWLQKDK